MGYPKLVAMSPNYALTGLFKIFTMSNVPINNNINIVLCFLCFRIKCLTRIWRIESLNVYSVEKPLSTSIILRSICVYIVVRQQTL